MLSVVTILFPTVPAVAAVNVVLFVVFTAVTFVDTDALLFIAAVRLPDALSDELKPLSRLTFIHPLGTAIVPSETRVNWKHDFQLSLFHHY